MKEGHFCGGIWSACALSEKHSPSEREDCSPHKPTLPSSNSSSIAQAYGSRLANRRPSDHRAVIVQVRPLKVNRVLLRYRFPLEVLPDPDGKEMLTDRLVESVQLKQKQFSLSLRPGWMPSEVSSMDTMGKNNKGNELKHGDAGRASPKRLGPSLSSSLGLDLL